VIPPDDPTLPSGWHYGDSGEWDALQAKTEIAMQVMVRRFVAERELRRTYLYQVTMRETMAEEVTAWCQRSLTGRFATSYGSVWTSSKEHVALLRLAFGSNVWMVKPDENGRWASYDPFR